MATTTAMFLNFKKAIFIYFIRGENMDSQFDFSRFKNMSCNNFISYLLSLSPNELSILGSLLGLFLSQGIDPNMQNSLGNFFELVGQMLLTISSQNILLQPNYPSRFELQQQINYLKKEIENLKNSIS